MITATGKNKVYIYIYIYFLLHFNTERAFNYTGYCDSNSKGVTVALT